jgi:osmotically-inducible protein OsmY
MAERYRDRDRDDRDRDRSDRDRDRDRGYGRDERGMMERAGDEVRSWFGDDEAQRRRERDERESSGSDRWGGPRQEYNRPPYSSGEGERGWGGGNYPERDRVPDYDADEARPRRDWNMAASRPARLSGSAAAYRTYGGNYDRERNRGDYFDRDDRSYGSYERTFGTDRDYGRGRLGGAQGYDRGTGSGGGYQGQGGAPGGYSAAGGYVGSYGGWTEGRGQFTGRGPKGYQRSDDRIREDVCDRLADDAHIDAGDIEVGVSKGEVTLTGFVRDREDKRHAEDVVERISGVREVHNSLRVNRGGSNPGDVIGLNSASGTGNNPSASGTTNRK